MSHITSETFSELLVISKAEMASVLCVTQVQDYFWNLTDSNMNTSGIMRRVKYKSPFPLKISYS